MDIRDTRYVKTQDGAYIAYQTVGEGTDRPRMAVRFLGQRRPRLGVAGLARMASRPRRLCRVILHDRRGTGLSSRNVAPPNLETRVSDLHFVLDVVGSDRPVLAGYAEAGAPNVMFAATNPERVRSLPRTERLGDLLVGSIQPSRVVLFDQPRADVAQPERHQDRVRGGPPEPFVVPVSRSCPNLNR